MKLVVIESPYASSTDEGLARNVAYARAALLDALHRGEAPLASHLLYTQVLDDADARERAQGIKAGLEWGRHADYVAVYMDLGISPGMQHAIEHWRTLNMHVERRLLGGKWART